MTTNKPKIITTCLCSGCGETLLSTLARCPHCVGGGPGREVVEGVALPAEPSDVVAGQISGAASAAKRSAAMNAMYNKAKGAKA